MRDLLQRLERALPLIEQWIDQLSSKHLSQSVSVRVAGFAALDACFTAAILDSARVVALPKIPFPPVSEYGLPEFDWMSRVSATGITFRNLYFIERSSYPSIGIHFHELVHVVQWRALGSREFLLTYALGIAQHGYAQSPLEAIAYDLQERFERGTMFQLLDEQIAGHAIEVMNAAAAVFAEHGVSWRA